MYDRTQFFAGYRSAFGSLNQSQVDGLEFLLGKLEQDSFSLKQVAYILATVDHETAHTFQPIKERRARTGTAVRKLQDKYWGSGYYGRGYCQITWKENYQQFGIADNPDAALEPETAYRILSKGMKLGMFTGKKLSDFVNGQADYFNARKVVNRLDKAGEIADRARKYESFLVEAAKQPDADKGVTTSAETPKDEVAGTPPPAPAAEVKASGVSLFTRLTSLSIPAGALAAAGAIFNFVKSLPPYAWVALAGVVCVSMVIGYLMWRDSKRQAHERTLLVMRAAADKDSNNLRLV